ncbi:AcrR family transcriptional regulator [Alkalihalobacillus xiaoxiensis]|uniref:AcrR family transcriptional regulator n=1 Tax=Shouchella xiaoxiensis TaxID=766895 RepID=A0ABS2SYB2_9BACI|nr:TetR/AcrR family transcriptional regulator [Shouchella xiaoxiensis]MBM7840026.1 AcrR family transcriptional regulator [Shouchella xiaoxiensis]
MKKTIPIPGSKRERVLQQALTAFCQDGFENVHLSDLATKADVTTGTIYHHFGSKLGLYDIICTELEQRIIDRMEAAAEQHQTLAHALKAALTAGINFSFKKGYCKVLGEKQQYLIQVDDKISFFFSQYNPTVELKTDILVYSSWQIVNLKLAANELTLEQAHELFNWLTVRE